MRFLPDPRRLLGLAGFLLLGALVGFGPGSALVARPGHREPLALRDETLSVLPGRAWDRSILGDEALAALVDELAEAYGLEAPYDDSPVPYRENADAMFDRIAARATPEQLVALLDHPRGQVRKYAVRLVAERFPEHTGRLEPFLDDSFGVKAHNHCWQYSSSVAGFLLEGLSARADGAALGLLHRAARSSRLVCVRNEALIILEAAPSTQPMALDAALENLRHVMVLEGEDLYEQRKRPVWLMRAQELRATAIWIVARHGAGSSAELLRWLGEQPDEDLRSISQRPWGRDKDEESRRILMTLADDFWLEDLGIPRAHKEDFLGMVPVKLGERTTPPLSMIPRLEAMLQRALQDRSGRALFGIPPAAEALIALGSRDSIPLLEEVLRRTAFAPERRRLSDRIERLRREPASVGASP